MRSAEADVPYLVREGESLVKSVEVRDAVVLLPSTAASARSLGGAHATC
ncbi:hypothetical protein MM440_13420 [Arsenicicoccus piscis]|nr:hypothetical protein [Arsenicicoccus piscis]MCH8628733.1 hypothetical protein [Arsenicicoccus piscis]